MKLIRNITLNNSSSAIYLAAYNVKTSIPNNFAHWIIISCYCGLFKRRNSFYIIERHAIL